MRRIKIHTYYLGASLTFVSTHVSSIFLRNWMNSIMESRPSLLWSNLLTKCRALSSGYFSSVRRMSTASSKLIDSSVLTHTESLHQETSSSFSTSTFKTLIISVMLNLFQRIAMKAVKQGLSPKVRNAYWIPPPPKKVINLPVNVINKCQ